MGTVQIIVPTTYRHLHLLPDCLESIKKNTGIDHIVNIAIGQRTANEKVGEIVAASRAVYDRSGLIITECTPQDGFNAVVMEAVRTSDAPYTAVLTVDSRIIDQAWFGKLQMPLIKVPTCGMTFAPIVEPNTRPSFPFDWTKPIETGLMMFPRNAIGTVKNAPIDFDGLDFATCVRDHLKRVGASCWSVPSCRVHSMHSEW